MAEFHSPQIALSDEAARQLANATKTVPQLKPITPRWLVHLLPWIGVEAGIYRLNRVKDESRVLTACSQKDERELPETFVDYDENPREFFLSAVTTTVDIHTRVVKPTIFYFGVKFQLQSSDCVYVEDFEFAQTVSTQSNTGQIIDGAILAVLP